jgi:1-phosphofructokinase
VIVTVTPNPGLDRTIEVGRLRRGQLHRVRRARVDPGGKGINVARVLAAHEIETHAVFPAGGSEGDALVAMLAAQRFAISFVEIASPLRVNVAVIEPGGDVTKLNEEGPELTEADGRRLLAAVREAARGASWVVSCGSVPRGLTSDFHAQVISVAHSEGARAAVDTSGGALQVALSAKPDLVKPNREELEEAVGWPIDTFGDAVAAARQLLERGARRVLASFGRTGALLIDESSGLHGIAPCDAVQSTVGAGDALLAGFLAANGSSQEALRQGVEWAAQAVATPGTGVAALGHAVVPARGVLSAEIDHGRRLDDGPAGVGSLVGDGTGQLESIQTIADRSGP